MGNLLLTLSIAFFLTGCGTAPGWVPLVSAGLGFGGKAMGLDEAIINAKAAEAKTAPPAPPAP